MNELIIHLPEIRMKYGHVIKNKASIEYCIQKMFDPEILEGVYCTKCSYNSMIRNEGIFQGNVEFKNEMHTLAGSLDGLSIEDLEEIFHKLIKKYNLDQNVTMPKIKTSKKQTIKPVNLPKILQINLHRVGYNRFTGDYYKEGMMLEMQKILDFKFLSQSFGSRLETFPKFELQAVVYHVGDESQGHYLCAKKNWIDLGPGINSYPLYYNHSLLID